MIIPLFFWLMLFSTCKKYSEGGWISLTRKHLFGGHKVGDSKTWKLKLYEVNGIDSTNLIQGAGSVPDFYDSFITFKLTDKKFIDFEASNMLYTYHGEIDIAYKKISFARNADFYTKTDSTQCGILNNQRACQRNILSSELTGFTPNWQIEKLTRSEFVLKLNSGNSYKIILTQ